MHVAGYLSGNAAVLKSYQVNATVSNTGIPMLAAAGDEAGLDLPTTTNAVDMVGLNFDVATYGTAQVAGGSPEAKVRVDIRPDAILWARMSGGAAEGTAIPLLTETLASTDGLVATIGDVQTVETDGGALFAYDGSNAGQIRKVTTSSTVAATVLVAFDNNTAVGDNFFRMPFWPMDAASGTVDLSTVFTEVDISTAVGTDNAALTPIEIGALDISREGTLKSYVLLVADDHFLNKVG